MAMYEVPDADQKVVCPYDNTHLIGLRRFPYHLMRCRKNYAGKNFTACPFNANHEMPQPEYRYHLSNCPDRVALHQDLVHAQHSKEREANTWSGNLQRPNSNWTLPESGEDWDEEVAQVPKYSFDTQKTKKSVASMTVAEKRASHQRTKINYQRKMQGLPPLDDDEPVGPVRVPTIPPPTETPTVFQMSLQQQQQAAPRAAPPAADNKVFAHSLKMAGIGRGRGVAPAAVDTQALTAGRGALGRGVAGLQAGHTHPQMTPMQILQALGRGRGILAMQSQAAVAPVINGHTAPITNGNYAAAPLQNGHNSQEDEDAFENSEDEVKEEIRCIRKKLMMVECLEARRDAGEKLSPEEQEKVDFKQMLEYQLQTLTLQ